jgi:Terminase small subunit.
MAKNLTPKQEDFCRYYIETGNASEAYRRAYNAEKMQPQTIKVKASQMLVLDNISVTIEKMRAEIAKRHEVTEDSLIAELEEARDLAKNLMNPAAMVSATMGKAKITGFDKKILQHQNPDGSAIVPVTRIEIVPGDNGAG